VHCIRDLAELETLRPAWEALLAQIPTASIFNTWEWLGPWWRAYGGGRELLVLAFFDEAEELVGLAPLARVEGRIAPGFRLQMLEFMGDGSEDSDNLDILAVPGLEGRIAKELLRYLTSEGPAWDAIALNLFPDDSAVVSALRDELQGLRWKTIERTHPWCVLHLPDNWDAYLRQVSPKERDNIRYYERRLLRRCTTRFYKCATPEELPVCLQALFDLHQMRWTQRGEPGSFAWDARRAFYHDLSRELLARNQLEFWLLDVNDKPAAAQFGFRYRDTVFALQQGFDLQYAALCVQDVLRAHVLRQIISEGVRHYDFLGGVNVRKERWGPEVRQYAHLHFARPWTRGSLYLQTLHKASEGKEWLREHLPTPLWNTLRWLNVRSRLSRAHHTQGLSSFSNDQAS
jgi:CelD/BcsL family acetyltransferase involved in cellulose biosynthesis